MNRQISDSYQIIRRQSGMFMIKKFYKDEAGECEAVMDVTREQLQKILSSEITERQIVEELKNAIIKQLSIY